MRENNKPSFDIDKIINDCKNHFLNNIVSNKSKDDEMKLLRQMLMEKEKEYIVAGKNHSLDKVPQIQANEIQCFPFLKSYKYIYSVRKTYRQEIACLASYTCPICGSSFGYGTLELDHVLPKSKYSDYSLIPINLIPICSACNSGKNDYVGNQKEGILSPYFDSYKLSDLLKFHICIKDNTLKVNISIINESEFAQINGLIKDDILIKRYNHIKHHINIHKVIITLELKAGSVLDQIIYLLSENFLFDEMLNEKIEEYLIYIQPNILQMYMNEEVIKTKIIESIINYKNKEEIYKVLSNMIKMSQKNRINKVMI